MKNLKINNKKKNNETNMKSQNKVTPFKINKKFNVCQ